MFIVKLKEREEILRQNSVIYLCTVKHLTLCLTSDKNEEILPASEFRRACDLNIIIRKKNAI